MLTLLLEFVSEKEAGLVIVIETVTGIVTRTGGIVTRTEKETVKRRGNERRRKRGNVRRRGKEKRNEKGTKRGRRKKNVKEKRRRSGNEGTRRTATDLHPNLLEGKCTGQTH